MAWWETANEFISENQALSVAVGIPILTSIAAGIVSYVTTKMNLKAQRLDRELQSNIWITNSKKEKIDELRGLLSKFETLSFSAQFEVKQGLSSGEKGLVTGEHVAQTVKQLIEYHAKIKFLSDVTDPEFKKLSDAMKFELSAVADLQRVDEIEPENKFAAIGYRILDRLEGQVYLGLKAQ